ncbi:MAG: TetR/AcrR family transcriptional regulator [Pseudomonadota bacterium]
MNDMTTTIKKGRKFEQVLDGARVVFRQEGYEGASVDMIAKEAAVSKATLYSYFPDKKLLFLEVAKDECRRQADQAIERLETAGDPSLILYEAGERMMRFFLSPLGRQVYRLVVAESDRFPELGREFYESGPTIVHETLKRYLRRAVDAGKLEIEDIELAADQFPELCKAALHSRLVLGLQTDFTDDEIRRVLKGAVEMFMARYGKKGT